MYHVESAASQDITALLAAARDGLLEVVTAILDAGAEVNQVNRIGATALMAAAQNGHIEVVNALIKAGADIHHSTHNGITALHIAKANYCTGVISALETAHAAQSQATHYATHHSKTTALWPMSTLVVIAAFIYMLRHAANDSTHS